MSGQRIIHVGIIIDGNRRYAKREGLGGMEAYRLGAQKVYEVINFILGKTNITELSIYALSRDNLLRKSDELNPIIEAEKVAFDSWYADPFFEQNGIKVKFVGDLSLLPESVRETCAKLQSKTQNYGKKRLNILIAYIGHHEISSAFHNVLDIHEIHKSKGMYLDKAQTHKLIEQNLQVTTPVDLVIRTAGEHRLSGFLPWQTQYAEYYTIDKLWPEVEIEDIRKIVSEFEKKEVKRGR